jgi:hypothetical protein
MLGIRKIALNFKISKCGSKIAIFGSTSYDFIQISDRLVEFRFFVLFVRYLGLNPGIFGLIINKEP